MTGLRGSGLLLTIRRRWRAARFSRRRLATGDSSEGADEDGDFAVDGGDLAEDAPAVLALGVLGTFCFTDDGDYHTVSHERELKKQHA